MASFRAGPLPSLRVERHVHDRHVLPQPGFGAILAATIAARCSIPGLILSRALKISDLPPREG